ncbi:MAG: DeoR/GlpR family DNA-binding transcription regulator [Hespellia sp.]|nr:DeoR/GlpR family DNA-binding transcription regulator [Hespellia sp.]
MLAAERHEKILEIVQNKGSVLVEELAQNLGVSTMTIRRDLEKLQASGRISRCHGGAVANHEEDYAKKQVSHNEDKRKLAAIAAALVGRSASVYLDAGTTTYEIAKFLKQREDLMIVTNDLEIARVINEGKPELMVCGGFVQKSTGSMWGSYSAQMMKNIVVDVGFFGAATINDRFQVLTPTANKAFLKRMVAENCQQSYLVVDDSKFSRQAMNVINDLSDYSAVITNRRFTEKERQLLEKMKVEIKGME